MFWQNTKRFLAFFFIALSAVIVVVGLSRIKKNQTAALPTPAPPTPTPAPNTPPPSPAPAPVSGVSGTFTGSSYQTPWGSVEAQIDVQDNKIIAVRMPQVPRSPPSQYAEPYLIAQALAAGSANIQGVSGATYTSLAFKQSLESAIAKAALP